MSKHWKEPYSDAAALAAGIHDFENAPVVGDPSTTYIYYVQVCGFEFAFFSLAMIRKYLHFYDRENVTTGRFAGTFSSGPAASQGDGQSRFARLPPALQKPSKRRKVVTALQKALDSFDKDDHGNAAKTE